MKDKTYQYDDTFKAMARAHQFSYRENILGITNDERNPQVILTAEASKAGLNFCEEYRELIRQNMPSKKYTAAALCSNMLRSEHIPYNIFTPMLLDKEATRMLFCKLVDKDIAEITDIKIEYAGEPDKRPEYLNDRTSFDAYVQYKMADGTEGGIGIEVKYTEKEYPLGGEEKNKIENTSRYHMMTSNSHYYTNDLDIKRFIKDHHLRQIWRNHILGYSMMQKGDIQKFHHIHLYPAGNIHFQKKAIPEYKTLLTEKGKNSFIDLTYEELFAKMRKHFKTAQQQKWIDYLYDRYLW
ncbi:MAG: hypothetical protein IKA45_00775 [Bacteroidales bacterium]|nr:hypothetical protein [Bacteroidales bacterium]